MAKSKSGGTRSYIRGKIGADVYSIGKNGKGDKQQVVRSLAEVVSNPQTEAQMKGRMIMSSVMQAVSALSPIIDHSFDGRPTGQPNISEFISRNYALVKTDVQAHPTSGNTFGLNKYQEKGAKGGAYIISKGVVPTPTAFTTALSDGVATLTIALGGANKKVSDFLALSGLQKGDYFTLVGIRQGGAGLAYARIHILETANDDTVIADASLDSIFSVETNVSFYKGVDDNDLKFQFQVLSFSAGTILSRKNNAGWEHNTCTMAYAAGLDWVATDALPTYPQGTSRFLNGGDI